MRTEQNKAKGVPSPEDARVDPEELWLDLDVQPEDLVQLDPLDITQDMVEQAEHPEEADWTLRTLPPRGFSLRREAAERERMKSELAQKHREAGHC